MYKLGFLVLLALVIPVDLESVALAHAHDALGEQTAKDHCQQAEHEHKEPPLLQEALDLESHLR